MFRLILALFAFMWSAVLDTTGGSGGSGDGGGSSGSGGSGGNPETVSLTTEELTQRTEKAAADKASEIAGVLGVDLSNPADVKALIEAGRKAQQGSDNAGGDDTFSGLDALLEAVEKIGERVEDIEGKETEREKAKAEQTRDEKLAEALKGANVRDDHLENAARYAGTYEMKLNDKGELVGSADAIEAVKKAMPQAFRGDGDTGKAADANGKESKERKPATLTEALTKHYAKS